MLYLIISSLSDKRRIFCLPNGKEPLEWLVLAGEGHSLLVITLYGVEHMQFHSSLDKVTWETSAVRAWLNNVFLVPPSPLLRRR